MIAHTYRSVHQYLNLAGTNLSLHFDRIEHPNGVVTADVVQSIAVPER